MQAAAPAPAPMAPEFPSGFDPAAFPGLAELCLKGGEATLLQLLFKLGGKLLAEAAVNGSLFSCLEEQAQRAKPPKVVQPNERYLAAMYANRQATDALAAAHKRTHKLQISVIRLEADLEKARADLQEAAKKQQDCDLQVQQAAQELREATMALDAVFPPGQPPDSRGSAMQDRMDVEMEPGDDDLRDQFEAFKQAQQLVESCEAEEEARQKRRADAKLAMGKAREDFVQAKRRKVQVESPPQPTPQQIRAEAEKAAQHLAMLQQQIKEAQAAEAAAAAGDIPAGSAV